MMDPADIEAKATRLETLLAEKFGARRGSLERRLSKAGRRLPRSTRHDVGEVAEARRLSSHPKLMRQIDEKRVERAYSLAEEALRDVDVTDRRKGAVLGMLGALAFNLLLVGAIFVVVLLWRGLLD